MGVCVRHLEQFNLELEFDANMARMLGMPNLPDLAVLSTNRLIWAAVDAGRHLSLEPDMHSNRKLLGGRKISVRAGSRR